MTDEIRKQIAWMNRWPCPEDCDNGVIPYGPNPDGNWEAIRCQFCRERKEVADSMEKLLALKKSAEVFRAHFDKSSISLEVKARTQLFEALESLK